MANSKKSEESAVVALMNYFIESTHIDCCIPMNDKGLLWDDHLHYHFGEPFTAENLVARIPIQVKGRSLRWKKEMNLFPIKRCALENYAKEGGIAYFVVDVANRKAPTIYYNLLTLVDIRSILMKQEGEKEPKVMFRQLIQPCNDFEQTLLEFIHDKQKQSSFATQPLISREMLNSLDTPPVFEVAMPVSNGMSPLHALALGGFHHLYLKTKEGVSIPIQDGPFQLEMGRTIYAPVKAGDKTYFNSYHKIMGNGKTEIIIGECLVLSGTIEKDKVSFHSAQYTMRNATLSEKIKEFSFMKDLIQSRDLCVDGFHWKTIGFEKENELLETINASLPFWLRIKKTLDELGVEKELSIENISDDDFEWIRWLDKIFNKDHMVLSQEPLRLFQHTKIVNVHLLLSFELVKDGAYRVSNAFCDKEEYRLPLMEKEGVTMPIYSCLPSEAFYTFDNIPFEDIVKSYEKIKEPSDEILTATNFDLLHMLSAYDHNGNPRLFQAIKDLAEWVYSHESFNAEIAYLNKMQIVKRERNLSEEEIDSLLEFAEDVDDNQLKLGAFILADAHKQARRFFKRLNHGQQKAFLSYPIAKFLKLDRK